MALALTIGVLVAGGVFMLLRRGMMRVVVGFVLISHGVNLLLISAGGTSRRQPAIGRDLDPSSTADPLPQAFVLTAVVIAFAVTVYLLVLAVLGDGDDDTTFAVEGRESETPDLIEAERPHDRRHAPQDWHAYLDRADDLPTEPAETASAIEEGELR
ncbi:MAG: cation:proton antiporter subunit C [Tetrasphaera sp.]